jgi:hypothetical protein
MVKTTNQDWMGFLFFSNPGEFFLAQMDNRLMVWNMALILPNSWDDDPI